MENLDLLYSLFNQYLFQDAKTHIEDLKYYYTTNPNTAANPLVHELLGAIDTYSLESIDLPLFNSILAKTGKTQAESDQILKEIIRWKQYSKEQILPCKKFLDDISAKALIQRANRFDSAADYVKYIKNSSFLTSDIDVFGTINFSNIDVNTLIADQADGVITSKFDWINRSFDPANGFERGQMVLIVGAPSTGKSLHLMSEALHMALSGHKVLYVGLGDNNYKDFAVRLGAIYSGMSFGETARNLAVVCESLKTALCGNLEISVNPAGKVSSSDIVEFVKAHPDFEVIMIDYDSNLKGASEGDSMYNAFGLIYEKLTELVLMNKLLYIAAQPKVGVWNNPVIQMSDVGESSRKQHAADVILTIGREVNCPNHLHTCYVAKNRRGENTIAYVIRLNNGRFKEIPRSLYDKLKAETDKRFYSEIELNNMIENEISAQHIMRQAMGGVTGGVGTGGGSSNFGQPGVSQQGPQLQPGLKNPFVNSNKNP